tara:strand:- start:23 stop:685 length:663 start_codon:yes stop_codon:yes gene_type:complete
MATKRKYAYYIKGNKIGIIQREDALAGSNNSEYGMYKSPTESIADGLEIQYTYVPEYLIRQNNTTHTSITSYRTNDGYLHIKGGSVNYDTTLDVNDFIVLKNAGAFNGLHKITAIEDGDATNDAITLDTKYSGSTSWSTFEETVTLYYKVDAFIDESFELDLTRYQSNAVVYYLKARLAEDMGDMEKREFFFREFRRQLEKSKSSFKRGPYIVQGFKEMM